MNTHNPCTQEPRLVKLETALETISDTLENVKELLKASIQADERIRVLQGDVLDMEKRLRGQEFKQASNRWFERLVWILIAAWVAGITPALLKGAS